MSNRPSCTFIVPVFNGKMHLKEIANNILNMASVNDELIFIDDGSEDLTFKEWNQLANLDSRIRILHQTHKGIVAALNFGVENATHEIIARMDIDDRCRADRIDLQLAEFMKIDSCGVVFCDYNFIDERNQESLGSICTAIYSTLSMLSLVNPQRMPHAGALISKKALSRAGGYRIEDSPCEDYGLWLRIAKDFKIISVPEILLDYSISEKSLTSVHSMNMKIRVEALRNQYLPKILQEITSAQVFQDYSRYGNDPNSIERKLLAFRDILVLHRRKIKVFGLVLYLRISFDLIINWRGVIPVLLDIKRKQNRRVKVRFPTKYI